MTPRRPKDSRRATALVAYLEGEVTGSERAAIEAELEESASARRTLRELEAVTTLLAAPAPRLESLDLAARVQTALQRSGAPARVSAEPAWWRWRRAALGFAVAAMLGVGLSFVNHEGEHDEFRVKSNAAPGLEVGRWTGVRAYRVVGQKSPEVLGGTLSSSDGLVFSYTNLDAHAFAYLMIFGVDAKGEVRWFYPAYTSADENPRSVPIEKKRANVALGDVVQQDFATGPLTLYALFSDDPADVQSIERFLQAHGGRASEAPLPGAFLQRIDTRVVP